MTEEKTIGQMLEEYNTLGEEKLVKQFGTNFRPRASFRDKADAVKSLEALQKRIAVNEAGYAAQEAQPKTVEATENVKEDEMATNGKKTAKKTTAKVKSATLKRGRAAPFADDQKIVLSVKDNPRRAGTDVYDQFELAKKHNTIGAYLKAGGRFGTLQKGIKKKWLKIV